MTLMQERLSRTNRVLNGNERIYQTAVNGSVDGSTDYITDMKRRFKQFSGYAVNDYSDSFYLALMRMPKA